MKKLLIFVLLIFLVATGLYLWWENGIAPIDSADTATRTFVIARGEGTRTIVDELKKAELIRDPVVFFLLLKKNGVEGNIQAGQFLLSPSMSAQEILRKLQLGTFDISVTIPEGKRAEEIAEILKNKMPRYEGSWRQSLIQNEGYLFPDTYSFPQDADIREIISIMKNNFDKKFSEVTIKTSEVNTFSQKDIIILASLIEREARKAEDRPLVSSVIHNRLGQGMKLDIDATVQYALGFDRIGNTWWKKDLSYEDLKIDSPFNTYTNPGLPPGPISNPGLAALKAAAVPAKTDFLYYISDKNGNNHYAKTPYEQSENTKKYRE